MCAVAHLYAYAWCAPGVAKGLSRPMFEGFGAAILGGTAAYGALALMGNIAHADLDRASLHARRCWLVLWV